MEDVIVVGGGIAGLTAAAFLAKTNLKTLLLEKENACGGLVNSFERDGFVYDGGIRAMENSGVLFPMLKALGLEIEFVKNKVTLGVENRVIRMSSEKSIVEYQALLDELYPESKDEIGKIITEIQKIMHYMDVQYGIDNPLFLDFKRDRAYLARVGLPWLFTYALTAPKIAALNEPVIDFLRHYTGNQSLLDIISQHFFHDTPASFALSYLKLYIDYNYPLGGTGKLIQKMVSFIESRQVRISTNTEIIEVDPQRRIVIDKQGNEYAYRRLIWAADLKTFYRLVKMDGIPDAKVKRAIHDRGVEIADKSGNDSVFTLYLGLDLPKDYFASKASEHYFYTPSRSRQSQAGDIPTASDRAAVEKWLEKFFALTTYEISCPVMRDPALAPPGKTGLVVSVLFDYKLTQSIEEMGWYEDFKSFCEACILNTLDASIYPGIKNSILHKFSSTPLTIQRLTGNSDGAITGWAFSNEPVPAESRIPKILKAVKTPVPGVFQAGQWTYSPSGLPISILTGKIAADRVIKELRASKRKNA
jgi:phytoene dehydrogenase-like protein